MVALRTLLRTHDAELRAFRRRLFSDAADSSSSVAHELNTLPRKMLNWNTPATRLVALIDAA